MSLAETISRKKWKSFAIFLILDIVQIAFVSLLVLDESTPLIVSIGLGSSIPLALFCYSLESLLRSLS